MASHHDQCLWLHLMNPRQNFKVPLDNGLKKTKSNYVEFFILNEFVKILHACQIGIVNSRVYVLQLPQKEEGNVFNPLVRRKIFQLTPLLVSIWGDEQNLLIIGSCFYPVSLEGFQRTYPFVYHG